MFSATRQHVDSLTHRRVGGEDVVVASFGGSRVASAEQLRWEVHPEVLVMGRAAELEYRSVKKDQGMLPY